MKVNFVIFIIISFTIICHSQTEKYQLLTYGFPCMDCNQVRDSIALTYGVEFKAVAGCVISERLRYSVKTHNAKIYSILSKKHQLDWEKHLDQLVREIETKKQADYEREIAIQDSIFNQLFEKVKNNNSEIELKLLNCKYNHSLIRGYPNKLKIIDKTNQNREFTVEGNGVTVEKDDGEKNLFKLIPGVSKGKGLNFCDKLKIEF